MKEVLSCPHSSRPSHFGSRSTIHKSQIADYLPWQQSKQKIKPSTLPPVLQTSGHKKNKMKTLISVLPGYSKPTMLMTSQLRNPRELRRRNLDSGKTQARVRLMRTMLRNRQTSLQELRNQEDFLTKLNQELIKTIQDMEDSAAQNVREMLQQQNILRNMVNILEYSNRKEMQQTKCELQELEEKQQSKISYLEQQLEQLNAKIKKTHEEVSFLSTYMDHEYPVRLVQIANLVRQLQQVKDSQQDELDDLREMHKVVLECLSNQIQMKKEKFLSALIEKTLQPHQEALLQKTQESQDMIKYRDKLKEKWLHAFFIRFMTPACISTV
ncbi:hypothetical protein mRhiFer1_001832 [Rhinolophus ferrumequinum]|uniref:Uncharacterized protein n=1 Tax=Rhinolophus ferrumequinum TaxID=59479 RepID=A0A7J7S6Y4_RHIFE|nr:hypothetical protein mRhiFer1_001832 [Rhinolophus ferrumequinum]